MIDSRVCAFLRSRSRTGCRTPRSPLAEYATVCQVLSSVGTCLWSPCVECHKLTSDSLCHKLTDMSRLLYRLGRAGVRRRRLVVLLSIIGAVGVIALASLSGARRPTCSRRRASSRRPRWTCRSGTSPPRRARPRNSCSQPAPAPCRTRRPRRRSMHARRRRPAAARRRGRHAPALARRPGRVRRCADDVPSDEIRTAAFGRLEHTAAEVNRSDNVRMELGGDLPSEAVQPEFGGQEFVGLLVAAIVLLSRSVRSSRWVCRSAYAGRPRDQCRLDHDHRQLRRRQLRVTDDRDDDRARCRHRLTVVHRHATPREPAARPDGRRCSRPRARDGGRGGAVRRHHGDDRDLRPRDRGHPARHGHGAHGRAHCRGDGGRRGHAPPHAARDRWADKIDSVRLPFMRHREAAAASRPARESMWHRWGRQVSAHPWRYLAAGHRARVADGPGVQPAAGHDRQRLDAGIDHDPPRLRLARRRVRARLQRPAAALGRAERRIGRLLDGLERELAADPGVAAVAPVQANPDGSAAVLRVIHARRRRTKPPPH